jgi:hypothetical protein
MTRAISMPDMISEHQFQLLALASDLIIKPTGESSPLFGDVGEYRSRICSFFEVHSVGPPYMTS